MEKKEEVGEGGRLEREIKEGTEEREKIRRGGSMWYNYRVDTD